MSHLRPRDVSELIRRVHARKRRYQPPPPLTLWTVCWWTAVGCAAGTVGAIVALEWMR